MLEKHGNLELTEEEKCLILRGVIPPRIKQLWSDTSLDELLDLLREMYLQTRKGETDGRN